MAARGAVEVRGDAQTRRAFRRAGDRLEDRPMRETHRAAGDVLADQGRSLVPIRSGALRSTIRTELTRDGVVVTAGSGRVPYARPIHYGWAARGIRAHPYLGPGAPDRTEDVEDVYSDRVGAVVRAFGREAP